MRLDPYLSFDGNCAEAFAFYAQCFNARVSFAMTYGQSPMAGQTAPEYRDKIMHTRIDVGGVQLMGSDAPPGYYKRPAGSMISVGTDDPAEADRIFGMLAEGGQVTMPIAETFWARRFGMVTDRFGTPWMVNCEKPA
ncbi:MAG: VOC family protein [Acetobacteraceae bacterium]|nr:VOC family protein [Acetobacteraceae bacterium]